MQSRRKLKSEFLILLNEGTKRITTEVSATLDFNKVVNSKLVIFKGCMHYFMHGLSFFYFFFMNSHCRRYPHVDLNALLIQLQAGTVNLKIIESIVYCFPSTHIHTHTCSLNLTVR